MAVSHDLPFIFVCIDNILIAHRLLDEHLKHLCIVLERLASHDLIIHSEKCLSAQSDQLAEHNP